MISLVNSVQNIEHTFPDTDTQTYSTLLSGTDITQCVPFVSWYGDTDYPSAQFFDTWFEDSVDGPRVYFQRTEAKSTSLYLKINVVEFDPAKVKVYQGVLPTLIGYSPETITTVSGGPFNTERAALRFYNRTSSTSDHVNYHLCRGSLTTYSGTYGEDITFGRYFGTTDNNFGHYYIFESITDDFTVKHYVGELNGSSSTDISTGGHDTHNSFLLSSYYGNESGQGDLYQSTIKSYFKDSNYVRIVRINGSVIVWYNTQLIEFNNSATMSGTYYCPKITGYYSMDESQTECEFSINPVSEKAILVPVQTPTSCNATTLSQQSDAFVAAWLTASGTTLKIKRASMTTSVYPTCYIVDWEGKQVPQYLGTGTISETVSSGISPVKSVENISTNLLDYVGSVRLSKGQDVSNCAVFSSGYCDNTGSYDLQYQHELFTYFRGDELYFERGCPDYEYTLNLSVVEFYPNQVKVQQGNFIIESGQSSVTVTIDEVDVSKTFLVFGHLTSSSSSGWGFHLCRGHIFDNTSLVFEYGITSTHTRYGSYFIVENLQDWWSVDHYNSSSFDGIVYTNYIEDRISEKNAFALVCATAEGTYTYPYRAGWVARYSGPLLFNCSRYHDGYPAKVSLQVVKFKDRTKTRVDYSCITLAGYSASSIYSVDSNFQGRLVTPVLTNLNGLAETSTTNSSCISGIYIKVIYDEETNEVTFARNTNAGISHSSINSVFTVCWDGYWDDSLTQQIPDYFNYRSFIKSIEKLSYIGTNSITYLYTTKNQNKSNCVPIGTWSIGEDSTDVSSFFYSFWFDSNMGDVLRVETYSESNNGGVDLDLTVLEFDPVQVRVQSGSAWLLPGTTITSATIDPVVTSKAFIIHYPYVTDSTVNHGASIVMAKFTSSTQLYFKRYGSTGWVLVNWYVVECLQDQWEVQHIDLSPSVSSSYTSNIDTITPNAFVVFSFCISYTGSYPHRYNFKVYSEFDHLGMTSVSADRLLSDKTCDTHFSIINFNTYLDIHVDYIHFYFSSSEWSITVDLGRDYDVNTTLVWNGKARPTMRIDTTSSSLNQCAYIKAVLQDSRTLKVTRYENGSYTAGWGHVFLIEFPIVSHEVSGVVKEKGNFASKELRLHRTDTGELLNHTTSSGTGYCLPTTYSGSTYVVCFDDAEGDVYNGLIETDVYPTPITDSFPYVAGWL